MEKMQLYIASSTDLICVETRSTRIFLRSRETIKNRSYVFSLGERINILKAFLDKLSSNNKIWRSTFTNLGLRSISSKVIGRQKLQYYHQRSIGDNFKRGPVSEPNEDSFDNFRTSNVGLVKSNNPLYERGKDVESTKNAPVPHLGRRGMVSRKNCLSHFDQMPSSDKKKLISDDGMNETFIQICAEEVRAGNRPNTFLNKKGLANVQEKWKFIMLEDLDSKQVKNKWNNLKKDWQLWRRLTNGETGIRWNPINNNIEASDEWWEAKLKEMPEAIKLRDKGILLPSEMDVLFGHASLDDIVECKAKRLISADSSMMRNKQSKRQNIQMSIVLLSEIVELANTTLDNEIHSCIALMKSLNIEDDELFYNCLYILTENKNARIMLTGLDDPKMQMGYLKRMVLGK